MPSASLGQIILFILISVQFVIQATIHQQQAHESFIDNSCPLARIDECKKSSNASCTSLEEALLGHYDINHGDLLTDSPHYTFTMFDLFYSGILRGENAPTPASIHTTTAEFNRLARNRCDALLSLTIKNSDTCQWKYTCKYNSFYFPSILIQAVLDKSRSIVEECTPLKGRNLRFVRTTCQLDQNEPHWCSCEGDRITTGYIMK